MVYELEDALLADGSVFARGHRYVLRPGSVRGALTAPRRRIPSAVLINSPWGSQFFGHWIMEDCAQQLLAESFDPPPIDIVRPGYAQEPGYRAILGLAVHRQVTAAALGRLTLFVDPGPTRGKRQRIEQLRARLRQHLGEDNLQGTPGVFVQRGKGGARRRLLNEDTLIERLTKRGFVTVNPEELGAREMATALARARVVVGVEGSHMSPNVLAVSRGAWVIELQPAQRFYPPHHSYLGPLGVGYGFVVCAARDDSAFEVDIDELERVLDHTGTAPPPLACGA
jgi:hypothetical protein